MRGSARLGKGLLLCGIAAAAVALAAPQPAAARGFVHFGIGLGVPVGPAYYPPPVYYPAYPPPPEHLLPGEVGLYGATDADADLLIVTYANGLRLSLQAARRLADEHGLSVRILDLRWLHPLPTEAIRAQAAEVGAVLVVDECRATGGGVADAVVADLAERQIGRRLGSVRAVDSFVPLGPATSAVLVGVDQIIAAAVAAVGRSRQPAGR